MAHPSLWPHRLGHSETEEPSTRICRTAASHAWQIDEAGLATRNSAIDRACGSQAEPSGSLICLGRWLVQSEHVSLINFNFQLCDQIWSSRRFDGNIEIMVRYAQDVVRYNTMLKLSDIPVSVTKTLLLLEPWPRDTAADTSLQPLIWCFSA